MGGRAPRHAQNLPKIVRSLFNFQFQIEKRKLTHFSIFLLKMKIEKAIFFNFHFNFRVKIELYFRPTDLLLLPRVITAKLRVVSTSLTGRCAVNLVAQQYPGISIAERGFQRIF